MAVTFFPRSIYRAKKFEHCEGRRSFSESSAVNKLSLEEPGRQRRFCRLITLNPPISNLSSVNKCISLRADDNATVDRESKILPAIYNDDKPAFQIRLTEN